MSGYTYAGVTLKDGMAFDGYVGDEVVVQLDADESVGGQGLGTTPKPLMLTSLAGCTGMDVISILRKKRQPVEGLEVKVRATTADEHPKVFTHIWVTYVIKGKDVDTAAIERAIQLSMDRYCPVAGLLKQVVPIDTEYEVVE